MDHAIPAWTPTQGFTLTLCVSALDGLRCEAATTLTVCRADGAESRRFAKLSQVVGAGLLVPRQIVKPQDFTRVRAIGPEP